MDASIGINAEGNKSISNIRFFTCLTIDKNCEFINCEFKKECMFKERCKFTNCEFDANCKFTRGCAFKQCKFNDILVSNFSN